MVGAVAMLVTIVYGRLPAGSLKQQQDVVTKASQNNNEQCSFVYRPDGGFVMIGATVSTPAQSQWPAAAQSCTAEKFTFAQSTS